LIASSKHNVACMTSSEEEKICEEDESWNVKKFELKLWLFKKSEFQVLDFFENRDETFKW